MGFSHLLVSNLNSVKYCALSVGENVTFRIICGNTQHIQQPFVLTTARALSLSLSPSLPPVSAVHTEPGTALHHSTSPFSLSTYFYTLLPTLNQTTTCSNKTPLQRAPSQPHPQHNINTSSGHHLHRPIQGILLLCSYRAY